MVYAIVAVSLASLLALVVYLARRSGFEEEKRAASEYTAKVKDKQLDLAARAKPTRADILKRMREDSF